MTATDVLELTGSERDALENLKTRMRDDLDKESFLDTHTFYRFLKARNFDVDQAEDIIRKCLQWRKKNNIDTITTDYKPTEAMNLLFEKTRLCVDKEGSVVRYFHAGNWDVRGMCMSSKYKDLERTSILLLETDRKYMREHSSKGGICQGSVFIYNMENLSFAKATDKRGLEYSLRFTKVFQDFYPEVLKAVYIINASIYFSMVFNFMKPFIAQGILDKFHVYTDDSYQEEFRRIMDENDLPGFLGGEKTDPDGNPLCTTIVNSGFVIPESLYIHKSRNSMLDAPDAQKLVLPRAAFSEIAVEVQVAGSCIEWEFETRNLDIGFGLFRKEGEGEAEQMKELVPLLRLETDNFAETGIYKCDKAGTYVMLFDNSYSWLRSKEIYYRTRVVGPDDANGMQRELE